MSLPKDAQKIEVAGSTVDFYTYMQDNNTIYQFDTSMTGPPEPMVNAMAGLKLLDSSLNTSSLLASYLYQDTSLQTSYL